ncbi:MAG: hypothetical protein AB2A00_42645 [Myxococcota bacterium]
MFRCLLLLAPLALEACSVFLDFNTLKRGCQSDEDCADAYSCSNEVCLPLAEDAGATLELGDAAFLMGDGGRFPDGGRPIPVGDGAFPPPDGAFPDFDAAFAGDDGGFPHHDGAFPFPPQG